MPTLPVLSRHADAALPSVPLLTTSMNAAGNGMAEPISATRVMTGVVREEEPVPVPVMKWKRLGLLDLLAIYAITWGVVRYWAYIITSL